MITERMQIVILVQEKIDILVHYHCPMKKFKLIGSCLVFLLIIENSSFAQGFLNKIREKAEQHVLKKEDDVLNDALNGKNGNPNQDNTSGNKGNSGTSSGSSMSNTKGSGLVSTPPDVNKNISEAKSSVSTKNYQDARYAVRQAMLGIEMEMGHGILKSLPESVDGLKASPDDDQVTSMGIFFAGLTIARTYKSPDKQLGVTIGNNSALLSAVNMYLANGAYASSNTEQNYKQVKFKDYRGILQYDESSGYTLSVPFGQSSIFVVNGVNFSDENEIMAAADNFDLESIKTKLGEK